MSTPNISSQFIPGDSFSDTVHIIKVDTVLFNLLLHRKVSALGNYATISIVLGGWTGITDLD